LAGTAGVVSCGERAGTDMAIPARRLPKREIATKKRTSRKSGEYCSDIFQKPSLVFFRWMLLYINGINREKSRPEKNLIFSKKYGINMFDE
jgi:hypothetical protein